VEDLARKNEVNTTSGCDPIVNGSYNKATGPYEVICVGNNKVLNAKQCILGAGTISGGTNNQITCCWN